ncbi:MAG: tetratricopeptide repeat protein [Planctomycetota bacterium]
MSEDRGIEETPCTRLNTRWSWIMAAALVAAVFLAYMPVMQAGFIWDDDDYVTHNPVIRTSDGLASIWFDPGSLPQYYPLVHTTYWLEYHLWGLDARGYHLVNLLLHAISSVLLYLILGRLGFSFAFLAAAVFALHPVHVESVAWITERKNTLSVLFVFLSLLAWMRWRPVHAGPGQRPGAPRYYWISLVAFFCALLSKTVACSLPAVILLLVWWKQGKVGKKTVLATLPLFALGLIMAWITLRMEVEHVAARGASWDFSFAERCLIAGRALWFYAYKIFWPAELIFNYARWQIDTAVAWQYLFPSGALLVMAAFFLLRKRCGRGPLAAVLIFSGSLVPALGFFNIYPMLYSFVADHFQYPAGIALIVPGCWLIKRYSKGRGVFLGAGALLVTTLGSLTWQQARIYESEETIWQDTLEKNPDSWLALVNLGGIRLNQGKLEAATELLEKSIALWEPNPDAQNNLGLALMQQGETGEAEKHFLAAIKQRPERPGPYNNLGVLHWRQGELEKAGEKIQEALEREPNYPDARRNMADLLIAGKKYEEAVPHIRFLLKQDPNSIDLRLEYGELLLMTGDAEEALSQFASVLKRQPYPVRALVDSASALRRLGEWDRALDALLKAKRSEPGDKRLRAEVIDLLVSIPEKEGPRSMEPYVEKIIRYMPDEGPAIIDGLLESLRKCGRFRQADEVQEYMRNP